jgi:hypothetical protein
MSRRIVGPTDCDVGKDESAQRRANESVMTVNDEEPRGWDARSIARAMRTDAHLK